MSISDIVSIEIVDDIAWIEIDNPPVNATSNAVRADLMQAIEQAQGNRLAVLQCAGRTFVAGGDMSEFDAPPQEPHLPDVVNAIEAGATPFLALLHGNVLGGGFEIAMACAYRIARPGTKFGLPEVNVGLIPGAGGTQRAPRLLGWEAAVDMACLGKMQTAEDMLNAGAIDAIAEDLRAAAREFDIIPRAPLSAKSIPPMMVDVYETLRDKVKMQARGQTSPLLNFKAIQWAVESFDEGQPKERALHLELRQSAQSKALRHIFFAERAAAKPSNLKEITPRPLSNIAIIGGGLMGSGIAAACLNAGFQVTIVERDDPAVSQATANVTKLMDGALARGKITDSQHTIRLAAFKASTDYTTVQDAGLAIEAVFEDLQAKRDVFDALKNVVSKDTLLATNTSYLNPDEIFAAIPNKSRCLGIHFFSPAHIMKLVEIVKANDTDPEVLASAFAFANKLRKTPVLSGICDGFIGNRILAAYRRASEYLLADGALPQDIDMAMRNFGMAMGPFQAQDMTGLQIAQANRRRQDATRDPQERYVSIGDALCKAGRLGQRSGKGWYDYPDGERTPRLSGQVQDIIIDHSIQTGIKRRPFSEQEICHQLLAAMVNEGARIVEERIARNDDAIDVVKVAGYGFPRWLGGPMHWASHNQDSVRAGLNALIANSPNSWTPAKRFQSH